MNVAGTVTDLKQRQGTLAMTDLLGNEYRVHFLASKVYLYGKRLASSKPLTSQLHVDDKVYFDAIPCFPEENNHHCDWFATCVHKGKKPDSFVYKDSSITLETADHDKERIVNQFVESIKGDRADTPTSQTETGIEALVRDVENFGFRGDGSPARSQRHDSPIHEINSNVALQTPGESELFGINDAEFSTNDSHQKVESGRITAQILQDIKLVG